MALISFRTGWARKLYLWVDHLVTWLVRTPIWFLFALPSSWRPRASWSLGRTVMIQVIRRNLSLDSILGPSDIPEKPNHHAIEGHDGVWIEPLPLNLFSANLTRWADISTVEAARIPGYWIRSNDHTIHGKVVLSFHGGGYTSGSAHPSHAIQSIAKNLLSHCPSISHAFCVEYRLSTAKPLKSSNPFPTALIDAISAYNHLIKVEGISPQDIILEGDSAGGNLALALTRYLVEENLPELPKPGALLLFSPWTDIGTSHDVGKRSTTMLQVDYVGEPLGPEYIKEAFLGPYGLPGGNENVYISPASLDIPGASFIGFPTTFISSGGCENLLPQIRLLKDRMARELGGGLRYFEAADMPHDFTVFFPTESGETFEQINHWLS